MVVTSQNTIINKCEICQKHLLLHHKIIVCESCDIIVHGKCSEQSFSYNHIKNCWECHNCTINAERRYNPFASSAFSKYDPVDLSCIDDLSEISKILDSCQSYNIEGFKSLLKGNGSNETSDRISFICNNIDGNATNFDVFTSIISLHSHNFSVIGLTETNIDSIHKDLYNIPNYICV